MKAMRWFGTWALLAALGVGMAWLYVQAWDAEWDARMRKLAERRVEVAEVGYVGNGE